MTYILSSSSKRIIEKKILDFIFLDRWKPNPSNWIQNLLNGSWTNAITILQAATWFSSMLSGEVRYLSDWSNFNIGINSLSWIKTYPNLQIFCIRTEKIISKHFFVQITCYFIESKDILWVHKWSYLVIKVALLPYIWLNYTKIIYYQHTYTHGNLFCFKK